MKPFTMLTTLCLVISAAVAGGSQDKVPPASTATPSLGELARQQQLKRKKAFVKPTTVFTNDNLPVRPAEEGATAATKMSSDGAAPPEMQTEGAQQPAETKPGQAPKRATRGESYYRAKMKELLAKLDTHQRQLSVLQQKTAQNQMQYYSDPNKTLNQEFTRADVNKLTDEIDQKKAEIDADQKALDDLRTQLRQDGGEPGWLR